MKKSNVCLSEKCESFLSHQSYLSPSDSDSFERFYTLLGTLTENQKQIIFLCLINKLSAKEIAKELSISEQAVYSRAHNAFKRLKKNSEYIIS